MRTAESVNFLRRNPKAIGGPSAASHTSEKLLQVVVVALGIVLVFVIVAIWLAFQISDCPRNWCPIGTRSQAQ